MNRKLVLLISFVLLIFIPLSLFAQSNSTRNSGASSSGAQFQLQVNSNVNGADVIINGRVMGQAPLRINLAPGVYTVKVAQRGYADWQQVVNLNQNMSIQANLASAGRQYVLQIGSNQRGANVIINGGVAGVTPFRTTLNEGTYNIQVVKQGFSDWQQTIRLNQNMSIQANLTAAVPTYTLQIQSNIPTAQIFVNNSQVGQGNSTQVLQEGRYQVMVQAPGYQPFETVVTLNRNQLVNAQLMMATGAVNIVLPPEFLDSRTGNPAAQVKTYIDGTPMNGTAFQLMPGNHLILITSGGLSVQRMINILPGQVYNLQLSMNILVNGQ